MEQTNARRKFLKNVAFSSTGVMFLSSTSFLQAFNQVSKFADVNHALAIQKLDLRKQWLSDNDVTIHGKIYAKNHLTNLAKTTVEVWHLSVDSNNENRAKIKVNANGEYSFVTDFPGKANGNSAKVFFKISNGDQVIHTELILNSFCAYINDQHYAEHLQLGDKLLPITQKIDKKLFINFNSLI